MGSFKNPLLSPANSQRFTFNEESGISSKSTSESILKSLPNSPRGFQRIAEIENHDSAGPYSESTVFNFPTLPIVSNYDSFLGFHQK